MPEKDIEVFIKVETLKLKEKLEELYIYQDNIKSEFSIYYNNEIKLPFNLEKGFYKKYGKIKNFFDKIKDIKVQYSDEENLIKLTYILKGK